MISLAFNLQSSKTLRERVLTGVLTPAALCQLSSEQLAEGTVTAAARQSAKAKSAASRTLKSADLQVVVETKEGRPSARDVYAEQVQRPATPPTAACHLCMLPTPCAFECRM